MYGLATRIGNELIEANGIATSGMSGSLVFLDTANYSFIGVYVGGPPLNSITI